MCTEVICASVTLVSTLSYFCGTGGGGFHRGSQLATVSNDYSSKLVDNKYCLVIIFFILTISSFERRVIYASYIRVKLTLHNQQTTTTTTKREKLALRNRSVQATAGHVRPPRINIYIYIYYYYSYYYYYY